MLRAVLLTLIAVSLITVGFGCTVARTPVSYALFADVSSNMQVNPGDIPDTLQVGEAKAMGVIGITVGDCSIEAARKAGGIKKIYYVDYHTRGILGLWAETTTKVYGE